MNNRVPQQLGKYEVLEEIGRGGFAAVYKARDTSLDRFVALKVLAPHLTWDPSFAERFRREAILVARLRHPNIVTIYETGEEDGQIYIAMEYLEGRTLAQVLDEENALSLSQTAAILTQVAEALDYAHKQGVVHRDIKPSNIMVEGTDETKVHVTLMDFGLVKAMEGTKSLTSIGTVLGSPEYMAPEQADPERSAEIGPATDIYALGIVAYQMLTGRVPFCGSTSAVLHSQIYENPPDPQSLNTDISEDVSPALLKALSKPPHERYLTAMAMVEALRGPSTSHPTSIPKPVGTSELRQGRRSAVFSAWTWPVVGILTVALFAGGWWLGMRFVRALLPTTTPTTTAVRAQPTGTLTLRLLPTPTFTSTGTFVPTATPAPTKTSTATSTVTPVPTVTSTPTDTPTVPSTPPTESPAPQISLVLEEIRVATRDQEPELLPGLAYSPSRNQFLVVFQSTKGIFGQMISASTGDHLGDRIPISSVGVRETARVLYNDNLDEYFVVWRDPAVGGGIFGRRMSSNGEPMNHFDVFTSGLNTIYCYLSLAYNSDTGEYFIVWSDNHKGVIKTYGRILNSDGTPTSAVLEISASNRPQQGPAVAYGDDRYLVVWQDWRVNKNQSQESNMQCGVGPEGSQNAIYGRYVDSNGNTIGDDFNISDTTSSAQPDVAYNPEASSYFVTWMEGEREKSGDILGRKIFGGYPDEPEPRKSNLITVSKTLESEHAPSVIYDAVSNSYLVVWEAGGGKRGQARYNIWSRSLDGTSLAASEPTQVSFGTFSQHSPRVASMSGVQHALVLWDDHRSGTGPDIYGQFVALERP